MATGDDTSSRSAAIGCSVRGQKNVDTDVPCQDDNEERVLPGDRYVIAAADGLGSASYSHVGSDTATRAVVRYLEDAIAGAGPLNEEMLLSVLEEAFVHAREQLHREADSLGEPVSSLNTTLLVAVGGPAGVGGAAVGDGGVVCHRGGQTGLVIPREDTEYENETIPLQSNNWRDSYRSGWVADADAAAVFSDGLDGVAWDGPVSVSDELFDQVFDSIRDYSNLDELEAFLEEFLNSDSLRKSSRDDKTLAVGALPASKWTPPAEAEPLDTVEPPDGATAGTDLSVSAHAKGDRRRQVERGPDSSGIGGTTADERLGGNDSRRRRLAGIAGVGTLVVVVLLAALLFPGPLSGGAGESINLSSAELRGEQGLVIEGSVPDETDIESIKITTSKGENETTLLNKTVNKTVNNSFTHTIKPDNLRNLTENGYYYQDKGGTKYNVTARFGDGATSTTRLRRGDIRLSITNLSLSNSSLSGEVKLRQGGEPFHKDVNVTVEYNNTNKTTTLKKKNSNFSINSTDVDRVTVRFAGQAGNATIEPALFETKIAEASTSVVKGETLNITANVTNTGDVMENQTLALRIDKSVVASKDRTLNGSESKKVTLKWKGADRRGDYTAVVSTEDDADSTGVRVKKPATFEVDTTKENQSVVAGENISISATIENNGGVSGTKMVNLTIGSVNRSKSRTIMSGKTNRTTFEIDTSELDPDTYTATVSSPDSSDSTTVTINNPELTFSNQSLGQDNNVTVTVANVGKGDAKVNLLVTYQSNETHTVAGVQSSVSNDSVDVHIDYNNGVPGKHTARIVTGDDLDLEPGDTVSVENLAVITSETASIKKRENAGTDTGSE